MLNKFYSLLDIIPSYECDILCISETFLTYDKTLPLVDEYDVYRLDRDFSQSYKQRGGGVAIIIKKLFKNKKYNLQCFEKIHATSKVEVIVLCVQSGFNKSMLIGCIYRPPNYKVDSVRADIDAIEMICDELQKTNKFFILGGDYNLKDGWAYSMLEHVLRKNHLTQLIQEPTRGKALLDLFIVNRLEACTGTYVFDPHISDHQAISTYINAVKPRKEKVTFTYRDYRSINEEKLMNTIIENEIACITEKNPTTALDIFHAMIQNIICTQTPLKHKTVIQHGKIVKLSEVTKQEKRKREKFSKLKSISDEHKMRYKNQKQQVLITCIYQFKNLHIFKVRGFQRTSIKFYILFYDEQKLNCQAICKVHAVKRSQPINKIK